MEVLRRLIISRVLFFLVLFFAPFSALAKPMNTGLIIREARCKVLIRGPLPVLVGDVLDVTRRPEGQGGSIGKIKVLKNNDNRLTAMVLDERIDCGKFLAGFVFLQPNSLSEQEAVVNSQRVRGSSPTLMRLHLGAGPGLLNTTLRGISREVPGQEFVEDYPLVLMSLGVFGDIYPFAFSKNNAGITQWLGFEGVFRFIAASSPVQVATPAPGTGEEVGLELDIKRINARGGLVLRIPLWKERIFGDLRTGYYLSRLSSSIVRFTKTPAGKDSPFQLSPLRDLGLVGYFGLGGMQFQPAKFVWARMNAGALIAPNYQVDNRLITAAHDSPISNAKVQNPSTFIFESQFGYLFKSLQLGFGLSFESFSGSAYFPDGQTRGDLGEYYFSYGLNASFLL